ncbi:hypothetical protein CLOP_g22627 [Closterium sp. NIES-67]|nr:hypothetical protein CLOP_g22627 [Closterium sp. NIES-67]
MLPSHHPLLPLWSLSATTSTNLPPSIPFQVQVPLSALHPLLSLAHESGAQELVQSCQAALEAHSSDSEARKTQPTQPDASGTAPGRYAASGPSALGSSVIGPSAPGVYRAVSQGGDSALSATVAERLKSIKSTDSARSTRCSKSTLVNGLVCLCYPVARSQEEGESGLRQAQARLRSGDQSALLSSQDQCWQGMLGKEESWGLREGDGESSGACSGRFSGGNTEAGASAGGSTNTATATVATATASSISDKGAAGVPLHVLSSERRLFRHLRCDCCGGGSRSSETSEPSLASTASMLTLRASPASSTASHTASHAASYSGSYSDVSVQAAQHGSTVFRAHRVVLCAWSTAFHKMLTSGMREATSHEIVIGGASNEAVGALLHFFYTGELPTRSSHSHPLQSRMVHPLQSRSMSAAASKSTESVLLSLLCLADRFCIPALHHAVNQRLLACIDEASAFATLRVAASIPGDTCAHLTAVAASLAAAQFERCVAADREGLRLLPAAALTAVLQSPFFWTTNEERVLDAVLTWAMQRADVSTWKEAERALGEVMVREEREEGEEEGGKERKPEEEEVGKEEGKEEAERALGEMTMREEREEREEGEGWEECRGEERREERSTDRGEEDIARHAPCTSGCHEDCSTDEALLHSELLSRLQLEGAEPMLQPLRGEALLEEEEDEEEEEEEEDEVSGLLQHVQFMSLPDTILFRLRDSLLATWLPTIRRSAIKEIVRRNLHSQAATRPQAYPPTPQGHSSPFSGSPLSTARDHCYPPFPSETSHGFSPPPHSQGLILPVHSSHQPSDSIQLDLGRRIVRFTSPDLPPRAWPSGSVGAVPRAWSLESSGRERGGRHDKDRSKEWGRIEKGAEGWAREGTRVKGGGRDEGREKREAQMGLTGGARACACQAQADLETFEDRMHVCADDRDASCTARGREAQPHTRAAGQEAEARESATREGPDKGGIGQYGASTQVTALAGGGFVPALGHGRGERREAGLRGVEEGGVGQRGGRAASYGGGGCARLREGDRERVIFESTQKSSNGGGGCARLREGDTERVGEGRRTEGGEGWGRAAGEGNGVEGGEERVLKRRGEGESGEVQRPKGREATESGWKGMGSTGRRFLEAEVLEACGRMEASGSGRRRVEGATVDESMRPSGQLSVRVTQAPPDQVSGFRISATADDSMGGGGAEDREAAAGGSEERGERGGMGVGARRTNHDRAAAAAARGEEEGEKRVNKKGSTRERQQLLHLLLQQGKEQRILLLP